MKSKKINKKPQLPDTRMDQPIRDAYDKENEFLEKEVLGHGAMDIEPTDRQNLQTQMEKSIEGDF